MNDGGFKDGGAGSACDEKKKCDEGFFCLGGTCQGQFTLIDLDDGGPDLKYISMAVDRAQDRVGVAYFVQMDAFGGIYGPDGGLMDGFKSADGGNTANYEIRYVEWKQGVASAPQMIRTVQRVVGVSLAFQGNGEPAVAYLGGGADMSAYWYQSDAAIAYRANGNVWTEQVVARTSDMSPCNDPTPASPLNIGFALGLFPSIVFDGAKAYIVFRDVHNGQFPQQDWNGSFIKVGEGGPTAWTVTCQVPTNEGKLSFGARLHMVMGKDNQPAFIHDRATGGSDTPGTDIWFSRRRMDGSWTNGGTPVLSITNTMSGGSLAWDATEGFGLAAIEHSTDKLQYTRSADGVTWDNATPVVGSGSSGWYPSLAMDPINHEPAIAYYFCDPTQGKAEGTCQAFHDELRITQRIIGNWRETRVDLEGAYLPKIGFLSTGKRVVAYRVPRSHKIRLAVER